MPSIRRGTSTCPRSPGARRSRPQSSESAWRSATRSVAWSAARPLETGAAGSAAVGFSRRSAASDDGVQDRAGGGQRPDGHAPGRQRQRGPGTARVMLRTPGRASGGSGAARCRSVAISSARREVLGDPRRRTSPGRRRAPVDRRRVVVDPGLALDDDDVAAAAVVVEMERHPRVGRDVLVALRAAVAVDQHLAVLPQEPDREGLGLAVGRDGREPADHVGPRAAPAHGRRSRCRCRRPRDPSSSGRRRTGGRPGSDLVQEGQRAGSRSRATRMKSRIAALHLALDGVGQAERRDRLDVQALVRLEQLEGVEREAGALRRRPGAAPAQDAAQRRDPAERARSPPASGRTRRSDPPPAAGPARPRGASRTSGRRGRAPCRRPAARRRGGAARRAAPPRGAPRGCGPRAPRGTRRWRRSRGGRAAGARRAPRGPRSRRRTCGRGRARR